MALVLREVDVGAAAPDGGGGASRRRPRDPRRADASWGGAGACLAWVAVLCRLCGEAVGSVDLSQRRQF
jgi:hypothetical protein